MTDTPEIAAARKALAEANAAFDAARAATDDAVAAERVALLKAKEARFYFYAAIRIANGEPTND